jgi:hypothetical protein
MSHTEDLSYIPREQEDSLGSQAWCSIPVSSGHRKLEWATWADPNSKKKKKKKKNFVSIEHAAVGVVESLCSMKEAPGFREGENLHEPSLVRNPLCLLLLLLLLLDIF